MGNYPFTCVPHQYCGTNPCPYCVGSQSQQQQQAYVNGAAPQQWQNNGGMTGLNAWLPNSPQQAQKPQGINSPIANQVAAQSAYDTMKPNEVGYLTWTEPQYGFVYKIKCATKAIYINIDEITFTTLEPYVDVSSRMTYSVGTDIKIPINYFVVGLASWEATGEFVAQGAKIAPVTDHSGHEIVENMALNKKFHYCRDCKVEVTK